MTLPMKWLTESWYKPSAIRWFLWPLSILYRFITSIRKYAYQHDILTRYKVNLPVIVVGNISIGGTGKTPFVIFLAESLKQLGYTPGIISRGYGGQAPHYPYVVDANSQTAYAGDEPVLMAKRTHCPVIVDPNRSQAAEYLVSNTSCDVIISDDGLQHYALERDIEIVIVDGKRRFGNKACLPSGPLREPLSRLNDVDFIVFNTDEKNHENHVMHLKANEWHNLKDSSIKRSNNAFQSIEAHAVAAIGNPKRFFDSLAKQGIIVHPHAFDDHHRYTSNDLDFSDNFPILMTEKDAVKCQSFASDNMWYLPVSAEVSPQLFDAIAQQLKEHSHG